MISILITLIIVCAVAYAAFWIIDQSIPAPMQIFAKLIVGLIALLFILQLLGVSTGLPPLNLK